jgi:hypothetical protein
MIIKSILDTDLYKFTTSYAYMKLFPQARGTFEFIDRDNTEYPEDFIERLYLELGSLGMLHLTKDEQEYMNNNCRFIPPVYWEWLSSFKFNSGKIQASLDENGHLHIKVTDYLYKVTLYEVPDVSFSTPLHRLTNGILSELIKVINSNKPYFIAYGPKGSSDMCIYPGSLNLTSEVITVGGIANARNSIFKLMKSNLISSNVSEECVTDKEFINFNDTY